MDSVILQSKTMIKFFGKTILTKEMLKDVVQFDIRDNNEVFNISEARAFEQDLNTIFKFAKENPELKFNSVTLSNFTITSGKNNDSFEIKFENQDKLSEYENLEDEIIVVNDYGLIKFLELYEREYEYINTIDRENKPIKNNLIQKMAKSIQAKITKIKNKLFKRNNKKIENKEKSDDKKAKAPWDLENWTGEVVENINKTEVKEEKNIQQNDKDEYGE